MNITGRTRLIGLCGDPVEHTLSPLIHNTLSSILNIDAVYVPFHTTKFGLENAVRGAYELNILGLNMTVPHKSHVMDYLCDIDKAALEIGAVNTLVRTDNGYKGYNTDMPGLLREVKSYGIELNNKDIIILGAGGAAKSVAYMCMQESASNIFILNRTLSKATELADYLNDLFGRKCISAMTLEDYKKLDKKKYIVFQSTSIGLHPNDNNAVIMEDDFYGLVDIGIDLIYNPFETAFMKKCHTAGAKAYNGLKMLLYQGIIAYELWNDISISEDIADIVYEKLLKATRNNIILTGFMGCGKTTVGKYISDKYGYTFVDTDELIEKRAGMSISSIFETHGEDYFRQLENDILTELTDKLSNAVISTGGGLPLRDDNKELLCRLGRVIYLDVEAAEVIKRLSGDTTRPLLKGENPDKKIMELINYRKPIYESVADISIQVSGVSVVDIAREIVDGLSKA